MTTSNPPSFADDDALGATLVKLARSAIERRLGSANNARSGEASVDNPRLAEPGATFVTLTQHGQLRGCIGSLEAWRPLGEDVASNALSAAFRDPRFPTLTASELPRTDVEVSLLSAPEPFPVASEADAVARLRPGVDGVILTVGSHRGTFLPQVWEQLPDPRDFLNHLKRKAGLPASWWDDAVRLQRYTVTAWHEGEVPDDGR